MTAKEIGKQLEARKIRCFVDEKNTLVYKGKNMTEISFPRYTDADKAITWLNAQGIENTGRASNHRNEYYKFITEVYL